MARGVPKRSASLTLTGRSNFYSWSEPRLSVEQDHNKHTEPSMMESMSHRRDEVPERGLSASLFLDLSPSSLHSAAKPMLFSPVSPSPLDPCLSVPFLFPTEFSPSTNSKSRKRRRGVQFQDAPTQYFPGLYAELSLEQSESLWYQPKEISRFKAETRQLVLYGKQQENDDLSGLERFNIARSKHKKRTIRCVILASRKKPHASILPSHSSVLASSDFVSDVSRRCTSISTDMALVQGFNDFCQVYDPLESLLGSHESIGNYNDYFFNDDESCRPPLTDGLVLDGLSLNTISNTVADDSILIQDQQRRVRQKQATMMFNPTPTFCFGGINNGCRENTARY